MMRIPACVAAGFGMLVLGGCGSIPDLPDDFGPTGPVAPIRTLPQHGSIYNANQEMVLFTDQRARQVGDIITVLLMEQTSAQKRAATSTSKTSAGSSEAGAAFGRPITRNGIPIMEFNYGAERSFDGEGDSAQSNSIDGEVAVTVAERLPNGNLVIRGEKWLTINQGSELIRFSGIVRPADISGDNTIPSNRVANARIIYTGKGALADSNSQGWLSRFFNSSWWPF